MRIRLTVCSSCGSRGRLLVATPQQVISRCHLCGDELRVDSPGAVARPQAADGGTMLGATGTAG
jgi:hypothetical protein